jgi:hypothetical protein
MEKFGGKVQTAALLAMGALALGLGGCGDAWRILTTGEFYWDDNGKEEKAVYAFRYDPSGGELYGGTPEGDIAEGETVTLPSSGGREGYTLTGFTLNGAAEGAFNPGDTFTMPAGEVTAAANWTEVRNLINLGDPQVSTGAGWSYDEASGVFTISDGAEVEVTGSTPRNRVVVRGTVTVTLSDAGITSAAASPFELESGANVTLKLAGSNSLVCTFEDWDADTSFAGLQVEGASSVTIEGPGSLRAAGGLGGAGIGGRFPGGSCGTITISDGTVNAAGGYHGAGIGGGNGGAGGTITIEGSANVEATGGTGGAGIGGGTSGAGGSIRITGGTVTATAGPGGAGIGGGYSGAGGDITISSGGVTAAGGMKGAGIGGGYSGAGGDITISGGGVTAAGGTWAAGIGGGDGGSGGTVRITGGSGTATAGGPATNYDNPQGVGPGAGGSGGSFNGGAFPAANPYTWW